MIDAHLPTPRRRLTRVVLALAGATLLAATLTACSSGGSSGGGKGNFVIGEVASKTGPFSAIGKDQHAGLVIGVNAVNKAGGILGRHVVLKTIDDGSDASKALLAVQKLVSEKVDLVIPDAVSPLALASVPYTTSAKVLTMSGSSSPDLGVASKYPYQFTFGELADKRIPAVVAGVKAIGSETKVGLLVSTTASQAAFGKGFAAAAPAAGLTVSKSVAVDGESTDLTPQLASLKASGAKVVVFDAEFNNSTHVMMQSMARLGWKAPVIGPDDIVQGDLSAEVPASVASQFHVVFERVGISSPNASPQLTSAIKALAKVGPVSNLSLSLSEHDMIWAAKWGYEQAKKKYGNVSATSVKKVLESIGDGSYPKTNLQWTPNPGFTATSHNTEHFDYSTYWGLIGASPSVNGQYKGTNLTVTY